MKLAGVLGLGLARAGSVFSSAVVTPLSTLLDGLVSYWALDEQSGTRIDAVGDNDLTDNNTVLAVNRGPVGTVASFVAANSESLSNAAFAAEVSPGGDFTVSLWYKAAVASPAAKRGLMKGGTRFDFQHWTDGRLILTAGGAQHDTLLDPTTDWLHIVLARSGGDWLVYGNGGLASTTTYTGTGAFDSAAIGVDLDPNYGAGNIANVGVWSSALSAGSILALFNSGAGKRYADLTTAEKVGLVGYWDLSEVSGQRNDSHGSNHLTDNNTVGSVNTGPLGTVASFVGANTESLSHAYDASLDQTGAVTYAGWIYQTSNPGGAGYGWVYGFDDASNPGFGVWTSSDKTVVRVRSASGFQDAEWSGIPNGAWHFVVGWFNPTDKKGYIQLDGGTPVASTALVEDTLVSGVGKTLQMGVWTYGTYTGQIGSAGLWSRVLDAAERTSLFNFGLGKRYSDLTAAEKVGLVSYWNLDEASGTRVDAHGDNDLTDNNTVLSVINAPPALDGAAASFVAANTEWLSKDNDTSLAFGDADFTISAWFKTVAHGGFIIGHAINGTAFNYTLQCYEGDLYWYVFDGTTRVGDVNGSGGTLRDGNWHHVVAWYSTTGTDRVYFSVDDGTALSDTLSGPPTKSTADFNVGVEDVNAPWDGQIDEVAIWSRVLTADERTELFRLGRGKFYDFSS
jgi:hypothetical protein